MASCSTCWVPSLRSTAGSAPRTPRAEASMPSGSRAAGRRACASRQAPRNSTAGDQAGLQHAHSVGRSTGWMEWLDGCFDLWLCRCIASLKALWVLRWAVRRSWARHGRSTQPVIHTHICLSPLRPVCVSVYPAAQHVDRLSRLGAHSPPPGAYQPRIDVTRDRLIVPDMTIGLPKARMPHPIPPTHPRAIM